MERTPDLDPAGVALLNTLGAVHEEHLDRATPCADWTVANLVAHLDELTKAFAECAAKRFGPWTDNSPTDRDFQLTPGWPTRLPRHVEELVVAWHQPEAWTGMTRIGGVDLPGELAGQNALSELVLHGWDLAQSVGTYYNLDESTARAVLDYLGRTAQGTFGPPRQEPAEADALDRALALSGRDPDWSAPPPAGP